MSELEQWVDENFPLARNHPKYKLERQLFALIWFDCMEMELHAVGATPYRFASEACDISSIAAFSAFSYAWLI